MTIEIMEVEPDSRLTQQIKELLNRAFEGDFSTEDWEHTLGGVRFPYSLQMKKVSISELVGWTFKGKVL